MFPVNSPRLLSPEQWQPCRVQLYRLRWGPPTEEGRKLECTPNELTAWRIEAGQVEVKTAKEQFIARAGDWLFLGIGYRKQEFNATARLTSLAFQIYWPDSFRPVLDLRPGLKISEPTKLDQHLDSIRKKTHNPAEYEWHFRGISRSLEEVLQMQSWFHQWLSYAVPLWRQHLPDLESELNLDSRVEAARNWLAAKSANAFITDFQGAADAAGLSLGHLNRIFMEHYHQTLHGFHEQRRIHYACHRLLEPRCRIKEVAHELGFRDLSKFSSWFKRLEQMSPRKYRNKFAKQLSH